MWGWYADFSTALARTERYAALTRWGASAAVRQGPYRLIGALKRDSTRLPVCSMYVLLIMTLRIPHNPVCKRAFDGPASRNGEGGR
jgi:hypothetical protein